MSRSNGDLGERDMIIAATRFGLGVGVDDLEAMDGQPRAWLAAQTHGPATGERSDYDDDEWDAQRLRVRQFRQARQNFKRKVSRKNNSGSQADLTRNANKLLAYLKKESADTLRTAFISSAEEAVITSEPFKERLVQFWSNHFAVRAKNIYAKLLLPWFEHQAIRPFVTGRFHDMLLAAESHPMMLMFLDNVRSVGPGSPEGIKRDLGLNENLAREVMELHTLGVNGGYTQADVSEFAKALTGWTVGDEVKESDDRFGSFLFEAASHEPGDVTLFGKIYPAGGLAQGQQVLADLAVHPSTARYLSYKLAQHFIADEPADADVARLAEVYLATGGDLGEVYRALIALDSPWQSPLSKLKQPWDYGVSSLRVLGVTPDEEVARDLFQQLRAMGQPPYMPPGPQGWYDRADDWADASSLLSRIEWARIAARVAARDSDPQDVAARALGPLLRENTRRLMDDARNDEEALAVLIASPEFQYR